ncbi:hypothetical protein AGLY_005900 [Aphis glycines]|uniref:ABC transporter domain-containing protein n=1 Tax=Aphis glycines TaxID=307491 RepID=A0A6G0TS79_APHGL|nr:hypothetical protein AGLY_005900 [Aphis glycines]
MDATNKEEKQPNPRSEANIFGVITFSWIFEIVKKGLKQDLNFIDLYKNLNEDSSEYWETNYKKTAVVTYFLWQEVSVSSLFVVSTLVMFIPLQLWLVSKKSKIQLKSAKRTDERVHLMNEIISALQRQPNNFMKATDTKNKTIDEEKSSNITLDDESATEQLKNFRSSLLYAILQELPLIKGSISVRGVMSYASQEPWVFAGSVKQNILFGSAMDETRYNKVIEVCALNLDLERLPFGDKTIVGEKDISLSGGQKSRINLARAIYKQADIYLLDDPLSAVDTEVGKHLFEKCINGNV